MPAAAGDDRTSGASTATAAVHVVAAASANDSDDSIVTATDEGELEVAESVNVDNEGSGWMERVCLCRVPAIHE